MSLIARLEVKKMKQIQRLTIFILIATMGMFTSIHAQNNKNTSKNEFNPITTGVMSLGINPDARGGGMGDLGVATRPGCQLPILESGKICLCI